MQPLRPEPRMILIAERDQTVRELQRHFLTEAGFSVDFADDGQAALDRVAVTKPVAIVTEIMIPKVDGLTLCRRLREDPLTSHIPVIVFSMLAASARAEEAGATAFLRKPLVESAFVGTIERAIAAQSTETREKQWASQ